MNVAAARSSTADSRSRTFLSALALAVLVAAGLAGCSGDEAPPDSGPRAGVSPTAEPSTAPLPDQIEQLMLRARTALNERRLLAPAGDNAIENYLAVLDLEANHVGARQALLELLPSASDAVERAIAEGDLDEAQRRFDLFKRMGGSELRLGPLRSQLAAARAAVEARVAAEAAAASTAATVATTATATASAPAGAAAPIPASQPAAAELRERATATVTTAAASTSTAATPPPEPPATPPISPAPAATPTPASAPATEPTVASVVEPRQVVDVVPSYPQAARQRRVEGWVELEFAIGADGKVGDVSVVRSEPPQIFDREAVRAAVRWRFEPRREDGVAVATRGRKVLNFKLKAG